MSFIINILFFCLFSCLVHGQDESMSDDEMTNSCPPTTCPSCPTTTPQMMTSCPPCPTTACETTTSCPPCPTTVCETTTSCAPCQTTAPETTASCPPCPATVPETTTSCPPCTSSMPQTMAPPPPRKLSIKEICEHHLNGVYSEPTICRYTCKRYQPYKIMIDDFMVNGEECWLGGKKGTCEKGLGCKVPPPPPSWW